MSRFHTKIDASLFTYYRCLSPKIPKRKIPRKYSLISVVRTICSEFILLDSQKQIRESLQKTIFYVQLSGDKKYCRAGAQSLFMSSLYYLLFNSKQQSIYLATITNLCTFLFKLVSIIIMTMQYKQFQTYNISTQSNCIPQIMVQQTE